MCIKSCGHRDLKLCYRTTVPESKKPLSCITSVPETKVLAARGS